MILHCFSMPTRLEECLAHGWWISFAGNVTYPKAQDLAEAADRSPARPPAGGDRRALPDAAGRAQGAQPARPTSPTPRASSPSVAASPTPSWTRRSRPTLRSSSAGDTAHAAVRAPDARVRHPPEPRPRPELPRRLEHPRRDRPRGRAGRGGRRARGRRRPRRPVGVPRRAHAARARRRARPRPGTGAAGRAGPARERDAAHGRRGQARPDDARPAPGQGRRQPALRRRRDRDPQDDRARDRRPVGGDGAEGGGGALRGPAQHQRLRCAVRARPARLRRPRHQEDPARRLHPGPERRLRAGRSQAPRPGAAGRPAHARPARLRPPPQGARPLALARRPAPTATSATARAKPWRRSATPPTPAPSRCHPRTGGPCGSACAADHARARQGQPVPARRRAPRRRAAPARLASSSRPTWPTRSHSSRPTATR